MQLARISFPIQSNKSAGYFCLDVVGLDCQRPIQNAGFLGVAPQNLVALRDLLKCKKIAWIKLRGLSEITQTLFVFALAAPNISRQFEDAGIIG